MDPLLSRLVDEYPDEVRVVYRHFPLTNIHANAVIAAEAAEAAGAQGAFWEYHDAIYDRQGEFANLSEDDALEFFVDLAAELDLDADQMRADLEADTYNVYVEAVREEAIGLGLPGTPALIVNGQLVEGPTPPYEAWEAFLGTLRDTAMLQEMQYDAPPEMTIDVEKAYLATVELESGGTFLIELLPQSAPQTVNSFVFLAREGWFDGVTFHRVLPGFVAQTGDPSGTGLGDPGYSLPDEIDGNLSHAQIGTVAMANSGPNTSGSQWYVTLGDASFLDGGYTIFGRVIDGIDAVQGITPRDPSVNPDAPEGDKIKTITIEELD